MTNLSIAFIGGGNMARSLIGGLLGDGVDPERIRVADPDPRQRETLEAVYAVHSCTGNRDAARAADVLVLAVKPQILRAVSTELAELVQQRRPLVISIAAGVRSADLDRWLGGGVALVRAMPNTPALVQSGATALYARPGVSPEQRDTAESILRAVGITVWLEDESLMDAVTAISGSGPAYFFVMMEALEAAGEELGLPPETARMLTLETALGAAKIALESADDAATLRRRVTSPGGTTEAALAVLEADGLRAQLMRAARAARDRSRELAQRLGAG